jgi:hypothetical protein
VLADIGHIEESEHLQAVRGRTGSVRKWTHCLAWQARENPETAQFAQIFGSTCGWHIYCSQTVVWEQARMLIEAEDVPQIYRAGEMEKR